MTAFPVSAQFNSDTDRYDLQGRVSVVIPFDNIGASLKSPAKYAPKLSFGVRHEQSVTAQTDWMLHPRAEAFERRDINFSLTFGESRAVMLNDQILFQPDILMRNENRHQAKSGGLDTYDKTVLTVIGVSLAVIAGTIIAVTD